MTIINRWGVRISIVFLLAAFRATAGLCQAGDDIPEGVYAEITACVLESRYDDAERIAERFMTDHPGHPAGPLFMAAVIQYAASDYEDYSRDGEFSALIDRADSLAKSFDGDAESMLWARYYGASAHGLDGAWAAMSGRLVRGILSGRSAVKEMERIVAGNPAFADAYLLMGSYRFWRGIALRGIAWIPFVDIEIDEGIVMVRRAIHDGRLAGPVAHTVLLEMLVSYDPKAAVMEGEALLVRYPQCRLFMWQVGEALKKLGRFGEAEAIYTVLATAMDADGRDDGSGALRCWWKLADMANLLGNKQECVYYCRKVLERADDPTVAVRQSGRVERARSLLREVGGEE